ncbi:MAG: acyl-ACP--UDP-N-acetylglucosamine O-acyltransferase [Deltaproteobacteria bacterium]|nr:acyl-ACP--UDP-N-acetylglucosamine O-acyltransferase [Deltaproteobacteria bacterium]
MKKNQIHKTAIIGSDVEIEEGVVIGAYTVIEGKVKIGKDTYIAPHVVIKGETQIGKNNKIMQFASIGEDPQDLKYKGGKTKLIIGDNNVIREFVTLNRGTEEGGGITRIGNNNFIMSYAHVAHDCFIGNQVILANAANLAGHIHIEDGAVVGALSGVHQFTRIGEHAFIGGATGVRQDIPPYVKASDLPAKLYGINTIGLRRKKFSLETIEALKRCYRIIFREGLLLKEAIKRIEESEDYNIKEVKTFVEFCKNSQRGITR